MAKNLTQQQLDAHGRESKTLSKMYDIFVVGREYRDQSIESLISKLGYGTRDTMRRDVLIFQDLGILKRVLEYGTPQNGMGTGRHYHWTLTMPENQASILLKESQERRVADTIKHRDEGNLKGAAIRSQKAKERKLAAMKAADDAALREREAAEQALHPVVPLVIDRTEEKSEVESVTISDSPKEDTRAIAGPEIDTSLGSRFRGLAALRKDEVAALIEAARQYQNRNSVVLKKLDELESLAQSVGIVFDKEAAVGSLKFGEPDARLESVGLLIPHIDSLNAQIERLTNQVVEQSDKVRRFNELDQENARLRRRNMELTTARTAASVASAH